MSKHFRTYAVVNPRSQNWQAGKLWPKIEKAIRAEVEGLEWGFTTDPMSAAHMARAALERGFEMVVSVGGDGTANETINGFFADGKPVNPEAVFGIVSMGTGCDFIKTMHIPREHQFSTKVLGGRLTRTIDLGRVSYTDNRGLPSTRYFINVADAGIGGENAARVNAAIKTFGGFVSFFTGTVATLANYKKKMVRFRVDDTEEFSGMLTLAAVANCRYFGAGMMIAPEARPDDGLLDLVVIFDSDLIHFIRKARKIYAGTILSEEGVRWMRCRKVEMWSDEKVLVDVDGELLDGTLPVTMEIAPSALKVKVAKWIV